MNSASDKEGASDDGAEVPGIHGPAATRTSETSPHPRTIFGLTIVIGSLALLLFSAIVAPRFGSPAARDRSVLLSQDPVPQLRARDDGLTAESRAPRDYLGEDFDRALEQSLTPAEAALVSNPLRSTPAMDKWARKLTAHAKSERQRAEAIFQVLSSSNGTNLSQSPEPLSACAAYDVVGKPGRSLSCQEIGFLYVALARAAGLKAYDVSVDQDNRGMWLLHCCAAVFIQGKPVLADPAYRSFDAAHKKFRILNDLEATALDLASKHKPELVPVACKLAPNLPIVRAEMFDVLAGRGRLKEAADELQTIERLAPDTPLALGAKAKMAIHNGDTTGATELLRKATEMAPETPSLQMALGNVQAVQGRWDEARQAYQQAVRSAVYEKNARAAKGAIALLDGTECLAMHHWKDALANCERAVELTPYYGEAYLARGLAQQRIGNFDGAAADFNKAIDLQPDLGRAYLGRAIAKHALGDLNGALADCLEAIRIYPGDVVSHRNLGFFRYDCGEFSGAVAALYKAVELVPSDDYAHFWVFLARSRLGEAEPAIDELRAYLRQRSAPPDDWASKVGRFLVGEISEPDFFKAAQDRNDEINDQQHCEAYFYAASRLLMSGRSEKAVEYLEKCLQTGVKNFVEYDSARIELRHQAEARAE